MIVKPNFARKYLDSKTSKRQSIKVPLEVDTIITVIFENYIIIIHYNSTIARYKLLFFQSQVLFLQFYLRSEFVSIPPPPSRGFYME